MPIMTKWAFFLALLFFVFRCLSTHSPPSLHPSIPPSLPPSLPPGIDAGKLSKARARLQEVDNELERIEVEKRELNILLGRKEGRKGVEEEVEEEEEEDEEDDIRI